jgi:hypothetical protein
MAQGEDVRMPIWSFGSAVGVVVGALWAYFCITHFDWHVSSRSQGILFFGLAGGSILAWLGTLAIFDVVIRALRAGNRPPK